MTLKTLILTLLLTATLSSNSSILKLDTKGHTSTIRDIIVTKSGDIISASDDKTIRVWDSATGVEKRKILGEIGAGSGEIYAMALSPNEEFLAVGGYFDNTTAKENENHGRIRIYNYSTGKLLKNLKSHTSVVFDLSFSSDGKYLISGSADFTAKIWNSERDFRLIDTIIFHINDVYAVKVIKNRSDYFAVTAGYDNKIAIYNIQTKKIIKSHKLDYKLKYLTTSKENIAVCGKGKEIKIYDFNLNPIKTIYSETKPQGLAYSPNGKLLIAGTFTSPNNVNIYSVNQNYKKIQSFKKHINLTMAVAFLDNQTAVSGGGNNKEIYIWNIKRVNDFKKIEGVGKSVWSVGLKGETIAWGNESLNSYQMKNHKGKLQKSINLKTFQIKEFGVNSSFHRVSTTYKNYQLNHRKGGNYNYADGVLDIKRDGKIEASIVRDATNGLSHRCYGFYKNYIISGGSGGFLKIYNLKGEEVANLVGHTGEVWSIAIDGDRLVSGSGDQTIRVWDLSKLKSQMHPVLNLFISKDDEWVAWTPSGYYSASANGAKYVGFHINQGAEKEAYYVGADKYKSLYRADIIDYVVEGKSEVEAIRIANQNRRVQRVDVVSSTPPMLSLISPSNLNTSQNRVTIRFNAKSQSPIEKFIITRNGEQINRRGLGHVGTEGESVVVDLVDGENIISIRAKNKHAISDALLVNVNKTTNSQNIYKPTLYLLSIGISKYQNRRYNLEVADKDAKSIAQMFKAQEGRIYKRVVVKSLLNENATQDNILDGLDWIEKETTQRDIAIIFIAGHGMNDKNNNYYFLSHDGKKEKLRRTAIKWDEIKETIVNLPSKVILLADTCHSGNIMGSRKRDITGAIKSIIESGTGSIIMTASTGRGYSIENSSWGHGAFTKALLEGFGEGRADYNRNGEISIKEVDLYITNRVKELTNGEQKPTTILPQSIPDFALGMR